jgi:hypothetical protein
MGGLQSYEFYVEAHHTSNTEGDHFIFAYSTDDVAYTDMVTIVKTIDNNSYQTYALPPSIAGSIFIRVTDTDQTGASKNLDIIYIDHMYILGSDSGTPDNDPPMPDPMTWEIQPYATSSSSISMTATTASDVSGVEYYFYETSSNPGGSDSGWQDSPTYVDTGLSPATQYTYTVIARDKSINQNTTTASSPLSATTDAGCSSDTMHVGDIVCDTVLCDPPNRQGQVTVTVLDNCGNPVPVALVDGTFSGDFNETVSATTNASGQAVFTSTGCIKKPAYTFCVDAVTRAGWSYNPDGNVETCDSN